MTLNTDWFAKVQQLNLPAVIPVGALPDAQASLQEWMLIIREDPLLTIHLFRYANKMLASHDISVRTLDHAVSLLGNSRLFALCEKVPRVNGQSASAKGLLRAIGDSLLAASLMRQWFEIRQIPWTEADYWVTLFYDLGLWVIWLLEPEKMENIEFQVKQGANRDALIKQLIGVTPRKWNEQLCQYFQLPVIAEDTTLTNTQQSERIQSFKQSALKFFLPFSHDLAFAVRQDWHSVALDTLCRTGEISLGLTEFRPMLKQWVAIAAREFKLPHAAIAARRLLAQQPSVVMTSSASGFNAQDLALVKELAKPIQETAPDLASWPEAAPIINQQVKAASVVTPTNTKDEPASAVMEKRASVNLNVQREIRRQFRNQNSWHSPVEIQESALYGLKNGLSLSRIVVMEENNGFWQTFSSEGSQSNPLLRNLKLARHSSEIITELSNRVTALWVNDKNRQNAGRKLPPPLMAAAEDESFFLRSFAIGHQVTMLLYADAFGKDEPLNSMDYQLFREYCADWNTALQKMKQ